MKEEAMPPDDRTARDNKVTPASVGHCNVYFIETQRGAILVDAGMPDAAQRLDQAFVEAGVDPKQVHLIIATHGHLDHIGSLAHAQRVTGAQVLCHRSLAEGLANGQVERATARNLKGRVLGLLSALMGSKVEGVRADIVIEDEYDLSEHGTGGRVLHTPGHSPSSISIVLQSGEALVGDMVREEAPGRVGPGMFYENEERLRESMVKVAALGPRTIYLSHSEAIDNHALNEAIAAL
jgi:glyoxylase-like metal-dependent hydrolase (beta-lactamase superfamily II)